MKTPFIPSGALFALLGVVFGAFGAHGLKDHLSPEMMQVYHTGVLYQLFHALGLILLGIVVELRGVTPAYRWSGVAMGGGIVLFSGSLYLLAITGIAWLGVITPFGGVLFLVAWGLFAKAAWKSNHN